MPDGVIVVLPGVVDDAQVGFHNSPVLFQIVVRLIFQTVCESLAEEEGDADQQQGENDRVYSGEGKSKAARNVLASRHKALRTLLYNGF